jgi:hypothetical protein
LSRVITGDKRQSNNPSNGKSKLTESKVKIVLITFFDIKEIGYNPSWQARQSILHTTMTFYGNCMKMCEDFALNFDDKSNMTVHGLTLSFSPGSF